MTKQFFLLFIALFIFSGCQVQRSMEDNSSDIDAIESTKQGDTTLTGKIVKSGETFTLVAGDGTQTELDSYKVDLNEFSGQTISVTGQYSGDTLFVSSTN
jgi:hypothetical protein